jgi:hypothetical protein
MDNVQKVYHFNDNIVTNLQNLRNCYYGYQGMTSVLTLFHPTNIILVTGQNRHATCTFPNLFTYQFLYYLPIYA